MKKTSHKDEWVYVITNAANNKKYVGSSRHPELRFRNHISALRSGNHPCPEMQMDYNEFGEVFDYEVVGKNNGDEDDHSEYTVMRALKTYDERFGYNSHDGAMKPVISNKDYLKDILYEEEKPSSLTIDEREDLEKLTVLMSGLDEQDLLLIKNGVNLLHDKQRMDRKVGEKK